MAKGNGQQSPSEVRTGVLSGLLDNAYLFEADKVAKALEPILAGGETVAEAFRVIRDAFVFTDKRLILIDPQGLAGKQVTYRSIPYRAMTGFAVETAGHFALDAKLKLWVPAAASRWSRRCVGQKM
ncbi:PH domain-containing protein [Thiohalocapsa marina]|uniref:PH domain-containing protein n=1 Tax=Thiohalocapsa marina TaxID=424902 RepID=UPI0036DCB065